MLYSVVAELVQFLQAGFLPHSCPKPASGMVDVVPMAQRLAPTACRTPPLPSAARCATSLCTAFTC